MTIYQQLHCKMGLCVCLCMNVCICLCLCLTNGRGAPPYVTSNLFLSVDLLHRQLFNRFVHSEVQASSEISANTLQPIHKQLMKDLQIC